MNVLVVGGAGYIGSHCVRQLLAAGHKPIVLDSLVKGHRDSIARGVTVHQEDLGDRPAVARILEDESIDIVMHFAAFIEVGESMKDPLKHYENNVAKTVSLLQAMRDAGVSRFVFSSSCTVLGEEAKPPFTEDMPLRPISAYGQTKADVEVMLRYCATAYGMSVAIFRYFNASGAAQGGEIGEDHDPETHLIPIAIQCALGQRAKLSVFGNDYPTPDGTCLRDYVHVDDLSRAHIAAFEKLAEPGTFLTYNLGTGQPASVLEIIETVEAVSGLPVPYELAPRRAGDVPSAYADSSKAKTELDWTPQYDTIRSIIESAWAWHQSHPNGYDEE